MRGLAWKDPGLLNSCGGSWFCGVQGAGLFTTGVLSLRHRTGFVNHPQGVQNCVSGWGPGLSLDSQRDPGPRKVEFTFVESINQ